MARGPHWDRLHFDHGDPTVRWGSHAPSTPLGTIQEAINKAVASLGAKEVSPSRTLRLVLRHDCMSTGCGEPSCLLCQFNPSRLCKRNLKNKYL
eukprot:1158606-Pelagomonas_calceolata.AAC.2